MAEGRGERMGEERRRVAIGVGRRSRGGDARGPLRRSQEGNGGGPGKAYIVFIDAMSPRCSDEWKLIITALDAGAKVGGGSVEVHKIYIMKTITFMIPNKYN